MTLDMSQRSPFGSTAITVRERVRERSPHSLLAQMMTTKEAARHLGMGVSTLTGYRLQGKGPKAYLLRKAYYYKPEELDAWKESRG